MGDDGDESTLALVILALVCCWSGLAEDDDDDNADGGDDEAMLLAIGGKAGFAAGGRVRKERVALVAEAFFALRIVL